MGSRRTPTSEHVWEALGGFSDVSVKHITSLLRWAFLHPKKFEMMIPCGCDACVCAGSLLSSAERPFGSQPLFGVTLTATQEKTPFSGRLFVHISLDGTAVSIQWALGHLSRSWDGMSHQRCHGNHSVVCDSDCVTETKDVLDTLEAKNS